MYECKVACWLCLTLLLELCLFLTKRELCFFYKALRYPCLNLLPLRQRLCLYLYSKSALLTLHRREEKRKKSKQGQAVNSRLSEPGATIRAPVLLLPFWPFLFSLDRLMLSCKAWSKHTQFYPLFL